MAGTLENGNIPHDLTREDSVKGGIRSGEVRREKATMRKQLEMLLDQTNKKGQTYRELTTLGLIKGAVDGKAENYKTIVQLLGEMEVESETPSININVIDNTGLESAMYDNDKV